MTQRYPILARAVATALALGAGNAALAADFYLCAEQTTLAVDGQNVPMWAFAEDDDADLSNGCGNAPTVPGPRLTVPPGDGNVTIHLANNLTGNLRSYPGSGANIPVSLVVPGQLAGMNPTFNSDGRMRSLTHEVLPGQVGSYSWSGFRPGSFMYHSGSHMAVQVPMGLYGGITRDEAAEQVYGASYQAEVLLFLSEIDPALHDAVGNGNYGPGTATTSTIDYNPRYLLVNGEPAGAGVELATGVPGDNVLVRLFNAGLTTRVPGLQKLDVSLLAEDGYAYPYPRMQETIFLPALKTLDALFTLPAVLPITGAYPVTDAASGPGAVIARLVEGDAPPKGNEDIVEIVRTRFIGRLDQLRVWATSTAAGPDTTLTVDGYGADGEMFYRANQELYDYAKSVPGVTSNPGSATVISSLGGTDTKPVNYTLAPTANPDAYTVAEDGLLAEAAPGLLDNDHKGGWINSVEVATATLVSGPANGSLSLNPDGSFDYQPDTDFNGEDSFVYRFDIVNSNNGVTQDSSNETLVTLTIDPVNDAPSAGADNYTVNAGATLEVAAVDGVLANDSDVDGDPLTATLEDGTVVGGTLVLNDDGSFGFTPDGSTDTGSFSYLANDGSDMTPASVTITVETGGNTPPVAADDDLQTVQDRPVTVVVSANDSDAENGLDPTTVTLTANPNQGGQAVVNPDGSITYTPPAGWAGTDSFTYTVKDDGGLTSNEAGVRINVVTEANFDANLNPDSANVHPLAVDDSFTRTGNRVRGFPVLRNDVDYDDDLDPGTVEIIQAPDPAVAEVVRINGNGAVRLRPAGGSQSGTSTTFTYVVRDSRGAISNEATCEVIWDE